ncbi:hypothetical protein [Streptosporangium sp. NPDC000239]|uniref:hypothetical protein n=1 Tax=unclassified Streptosporangium TaxID=2632669 RepID=UPI003325FCBF
MTTFAQLRKTALSLPGTAEQGDRPGVIAFTVHGSLFASTGDNDHVHLHLPATEAEKVLAAYPTAEPLPHDGTSAGVRVPLVDIDGQQLNHWVRRAWFSHAPRQLARQAAAGETAVAGETGDLPKAIGGPATRALAGVGITTLAQVAELTEAELMAMHGVGPKAVRVLGEALRAAGHERGN